MSAKFGVRTYGAPPPAHGAGARLATVYSGAMRELHRVVVAGSALYFAAGSHEDVRRSGFLGYRVEPTRSALFPFNTENAGCIAVRECAILAFGSISV